MKVSRSEGYNRKDLQTQSFLFFALWNTLIVDYIFMVKADVDLDVSPNEVRDVKYVTPEELRAMFADASVPMTPWFKLICNTFLFKWWANIDSLESQKDERTIHRLGFD